MSTQRHRGKATAEQSQAIRLRHLGTAVANGIEIAQQQALANSSLS